MKRTLSVLLIALTIPLNAQPATEKFDLARAITREAERFAENNRFSHPVGNSQVASSGRSDWSRVRTLAAGTKVIVTVQGVKYFSRYVVAADDAEITVLNFVDPALPYDVRRVLLGLASRQPAYFAISQQPEVFVDGNVRVDPEGVFVGGQKATTLERLVERFATHEITEIRAYPGQAGSTFMGNFGGLFALGGAIAGIVGGGMLGHRQFAHHKALGATLGAAGGYVVGISTGFGIMAIGGAFREDVIYRAP